VGAIDHSEDLDVDDDLEVKSNPLKVEPLKFEEAYPVLSTTWRLVD
jgi:hypothetical protein